MTSTNGVAPVNEYYALELPDDENPNGAEPAVAEEETEEVMLSPVLYETWQWLTDHDRPEGVTGKEVMDGLGLNTEAAANFRLGQLVEKGMAYRVTRGYYRVGDDPRPFAVPPTRRKKKKAPAGGRRLKAEDTEVQVLRVYRYRGVQVTVNPDGSIELPRVHLSAEGATALATIMERIHDMNSVLGLGRSKVTRNL